MSERPRALAVGAHPDDVEFGMAGTLIQLGKKGYELHILTLANGSCGTAEYDEETIIRIRREEAARAAALIGATYHPGLVKDLEIFYNGPVLRKACAKVREINPHILLVPSYDDYMEDHSECARVMVMAAFCKGMRNFTTDPVRPPVFGDTYIYHAQPHGLHDAMRRVHPPELYVNVAAEVDAKEAMLRCHASQKNWLDVSQGMDSYLKSMRDLCAELARRAGQGWSYAEGWQRHSHLGFAQRDADPLAGLLADTTYRNPDYLRGLIAPTS